LPDLPVPLKDAKRQGKRENCYPARQGRKSVNSEQIFDSGRSKFRVLRRKTIQILREKRARLVRRGESLTPLIEIIKRFEGASQGGGNVSIRVTLGADMRNSSQGKIARRL